MGKGKKRGPPPKFATASSNWNTHYNVLFDDLLNSPAFVALTPHAQMIYIRLLQEYKGEQYTGNKVICPYSTLVEKGYRRNTIAKAIQMLVHFGFITYEKGGLEHQPNIYHFSEGWKKIWTKEDVDATMTAFKEEENLKKLAAEQKKAIDNEDTVVGAYG